MDFPAIKRLVNTAGINPSGLAWHRFVVAETADGQFAGCGQLKPHSGGVIELASIAVVPSFRMQGIGVKIVRKLISDASCPIYLTCREQLGPFYQKIGFRIITGSEMPDYFNRISHIARLVNSLHLIHDKLLVMVLD